MCTTPWRITRVHKETRDTFTMSFEPEDEASRMQFSPGQFNMLYVFGVGEIPISISSDPDGSELISHTTRKVGLVTNALGKLGKGSSIGIRGPYGSSWPIDQARGKDVVVVAGGIGLAPLRPALVQLVSRRDEFNNIILLYGARSPEEMLYRKDLKDWSAHLDMQVYVTVDRATVGWNGMVGVVTPLIQRAPFDAENAIALVCGPEIMMQHATVELHRRGLSDGNIYVSMERNMKCGVGFCGHCQYGPEFVCKDGPVFRFDKIAHLFGKNEV